MGRLNSHLPEIFESKFKRKPKMWNLEELHDLYIRTKIRATRRSSLTQSIMSKIDEEIPKFDGKSCVYFYQNSGDKTYLRQYEFTWKDKYNEFTSFSIKDCKLKSREERLDFILSNERAFDLGDQFFRTKRSEDVAWRTCLKVKDILWEGIEKKLQKIYNSKSLQQTIIIEISGQKYFVHVDNGFGYPKFSLKNEFNDEILKLT